MILHMAKDFLAIPRASVSVEHLFSSFQHMYADTCCSLKVETITELMCIKEWIREGLLIISGLGKMFYKI